MLIQNCCKLSPHICSGVHVPQFRRILLSIALFVFSPSFYCPMCCYPFFDFWLLIIFLVTSNFSIMYRLSIDILIIYVPSLRIYYNQKNFPLFFQTVLYSNADINQYFHIHTRVEENNNWVSLTFFILSTCWYHTHLYVIKSNKQTLLLFWLQRPFFKCLDTLKFFVFKYYVIS